jgi:hypothetical protein
MFAQVIISPLIPRLTEAFAVSNGAIGLVFTGMWVILALLQSPAGVPRRASPRERPREKFASA